MDTYQKIIETAIVVLNEDFSATVEDIATNCGLNRRTLHRYFKSRQELLEACYSTMMAEWKDAAKQAFDEAGTPLLQLEQLLYAGINSGTKYTFLTKLMEVESFSSSAQTEKNDDYLKMRNELFGSIQTLQKEGLIEETLPIAWIRMLFTSIVTATVMASRSGDIAPNDVKRLAWYSFRKSIGIH